MAMSMRSRGGLSGSTNRPRIGLRPVYSDFKPRMELKEDPEAHIVYIHLPGFLKENIKIVAESSGGLLRVRGERLASANTWSRFQEEVQVPENCDVTKTHAKFEGGVLRITMPKRISVGVSQSPATLSDEASTPERSPPKPTRPSPLPHPAPSSQPPPSMRPNVLPQPQTTTTTPRLPALPPQQTQMTGLTASEAIPSPKMSEPRFPPSIQLKPRENVEPKQSSLPRPTLLPPPPQPKSGSFIPNINSKPPEHEKPKFEANQKTSQQPIPTKSSPEGLPQRLQYPDLAPRKDSTVSERRISEPNIPMPLADLVPAEKSSLERMKQALPHQDLVPQKDPIASERMRSESNTPMPPRKPLPRDSPMTALTADEKHNKAIQGMSIRRLNDDRQLLVNMGVAVMVIVALGAWISNSFGSFAKSDN